MPSPLLIQTALQAGRKLEHVCGAFKLDVSRSKQYPNLVQFKYGIGSDLNDMLVKQCRGVILDEADNWRCIARPFDKFFNLHESGAAKIDWATARVQEKLDGSLMILYYYDHGWHVATSGMCDASGAVGTDLLGGMTFRDLFWRTFFEKNYVVPTTWRGYTFMFELMTPYNKIVVQHRECNLKLIGVRHTESGTEWPITSSLGMYQSVQQFQLSTIDQIIESFNTMEPLEQEGYVVVDKDYNRVKIKHPGYVALHHMRSAFSLRYAVELVKKADIEEIIAYFPEWKDLLLDIRTKYNAQIQDIETVYEALKAIEGQKDFASQATSYPFAGILFWLRSGKFKTARQGLEEMHIDRLISLLGLKKESIDGAGGHEKHPLTDVA